MQLQAMTPQEVKESKIYLEWAMSEEEYAQVEKILGRLPNYTETGLFAAMWSEHCSYKNSTPVLRQFYTEGPQVLQGPGEGAGIVDIGDEQAVVFKMESHNSPSAVEPYQGAATGVGGILRDIFSMGARPIANLSGLRFGNLSNPRTREIVKGVIEGVAGYSNTIGIPTVGSDTKFDDAYDGNPLVNVFSLGILDHAQMQVGRAEGVGNVVMYVGATTGRDGIHGASFSSVEFGDDDPGQQSAVQAGDPFLEKQVMEACLELIREHSDILVGIQDMGAAGIVSSSAEMASKADSGLKLNMDLVPQREENMTAYEMLLSESQERMLLCVAKGHEQTVIDLFTRYGLHAVAIGEVVEGDRYQVYQHGELVADVPVKALDEDAPVYENEATEPKRMALYRDQEAFVPTVDNLEETIETLIQTPDLADQSELFQSLDSQVRGQTVFGPSSDAAVVRVPDTHKGIAMAVGCNQRYIYLDPFVGGEIAVASCARRLVATGAKPLASTDGLNFGSPKDPETFFELMESAKGISKAVEAFDAPIISGNVSMYNANPEGPVYPTPMIGMVGLIQELDTRVDNKFTQAGDQIYIVGETKADFSGSIIQKTQAGEISGLIDFDLEQEMDNQAFVQAANGKELLAQAHAVEEGGLAMALLQSAFGTDYGFKVKLAMDDHYLFSETQSRYILSVASEDVAAFEQLIKEHDNVRVEAVGEVTDQNKVELITNESSLVLDKQSLQTKWSEALLCQLND